MGTVAVGNTVMTRFCCPGCAFEYSIIRQKEPSAREPRCERCEMPLPDDVGDDWLHYTAVSDR